MYCKPNTLFSILVLSAIAHLDCGSFSNKENAGYSGKNTIYRDSHKLADETKSRRIRSVTNPKRETPKLESSTSSKGHQNKTQAYHDVSERSHNEKNRSSSIRSFNKRAFDIHTGFQQDATAFQGAGASGNVYSPQHVSNPQASGLFLPFQPIIHCSEDVMTLTAHGREYTHILVDRADATPIYLFQLPSYCGYNIRVTWRDLVLVAPYDGCYITQENGSYVLSLFWWGRPLKISCPMTHVISQPTPSVFCSHFGMIIQIEGAQEPVEKHRVKVNGEILPLLSETCAHLLNSPPDVVILHTAFSSRCVTLTDGDNRLVIIVDGKQFTLSCLFPHHLSPFLPYFNSHPFHQPLQPNQEQESFIPHIPASITLTGTVRQPTTPPKTETSQPPAVPHLPYEQSLVPQFYPHTSVQDTHPIHQMYPPGVHQHPEHFMFPPHHPDDTSGFSSQQYLSVPQIPSAHTSHSTTTEEEKVDDPMMPPPHYSPHPIFCPPYPDAFCSQYHPTIQPIPEIPRTSPEPPEASIPLTPPPQQFTLLPQLPLFSPVPPEPPPKISSPSLTCTRNRITATLPFAKLDSVKVKDAKTNTWMSIASVAADCNYTLRSRGDAVVMSSPLPACHTHKLSSSVISLFIRFWDSSQLRTRTLQLQCRFSRDTDSQSRVPPDTPLHQILPHQTTRTPARLPLKVQLLCSSQHMSVKVPPGPTSGLVVEAPSSGIKTQTKAVALLEAPSHCGYSVKRNNEGAFNIILPYSSCHMIHQDGQHKIILKYQALHGRTVGTLLSCQASDSQECNVAIDQQLICGSGSLSSSECQDKGCCYSLDAQMCYYPMDECTADRHFVFSVHSSVSNPPLFPSTLVTAGNSSCSPQKITADFALFKIPLDECGVHRYEVGKTIIYMVEILNRVQSVSLNYGTITRDSPVRLLVECRYLPGSVVSVGYLVKSPSLGPSIKAQGVFGVQLRIAKDEHYNDFYPQYHQPLRVLLGKPLYLEVRLLNPPDPTAILLVHYCVAYPRSAQSAWILIYDGCPNSLDQTPTHKPPATPAEALINHVRRFTVTTFQFLPEDDNLQTDEEIYFMCSTEVCLPSDGPCVEGCFGDPDDVKS